MGERKNLFFGTPLARRVNERNKDNEECILANRRANLDRQQSVRDSQGRRRFHGAFTGGFSAGYYGTVDSATGFHPKSFVARRGGQDETCTFQHHPEDYMDEEDFGEFGIAPKKVRLVGNYLGSRDHAIGKNRKTIDDFLRIENESIGEKILKQMSGGRSRLVSRDASQFQWKGDYHGLGYRGLSKVNVRRTAFGSCNPLIALTDTGRKLEISGEAFGGGVIEDEDDQIMSLEEYGIDDLRSYNLTLRGNKSENKLDRDYNISHAASRSTSFDDANIIEGFELAESVDAIQLWDHGESVKFPLPIIPPDWRPPTRATPYVPPDDEKSIRIKLQQTTQKSREFGAKFTSGSTSHLITGGNASRPGLLSYNDLKAQVLKDPPNPPASCREQVNPRPTVVRKVLDWHPCSLLCKHFNVPNPYPNIQFSGVKPQDLFESEPLDRTRDMSFVKIAPIELRRSIFNMSFDIGETIVINDIRDDEDQPQVLLLKEESNLGLINHKNDDENPADNIEGDLERDSDIVVFDAPKPEPELIVLSSSSSSSPEHSRPARELLSFDDHDEEESAYGPPLPPTIETLMKIECQRSRSSSRHASVKSHRKHKKHKRRH